MISDILSDAVENMRRYQKFYDRRTWKKIDTVITAMNLLRVELDTPPFGLPQEDPNPVKRERT